MERYRTTIILLALMLVLGGLAIVLNGKNGAGGVGVNASPTALPPVSIWQYDNPVVGIDVVSGTGHVSLTKDISTTIWTLTQPIKDVADPFAVGNVADQLKSLQATSAVTQTGDLAQFGLDKGGMTVTSTFSDTAHTRRTIQVGAATFDGSGYYVKTTDKPTLYIVSNSTIEPIRSWLQTPPRNPPSPTPLLPTLVPTSEVTATGTITVGRTPIPGATIATVTAGTGSTAAGTASPSTTASGAPSPSGEITPAATGTTLSGSSTISGTNGISSSPPSGANATTPLVTVPVVTGTARP